MARSAIFPPPSAQAAPDASGARRHVAGGLCLLLAIALSLWGSGAASQAPRSERRGPVLSIPLQPARPFANGVLQTPDNVVGVPGSAADQPILSLAAAFDTGPAARPYVFQATSPDSMARAVLCLTSAIYYEAASESEEGQRAVAQVILNRVRHPDWPASVCGVVYQGSDKPGCQFSYACDGAMARRPVASAWARAARIAQAALSGAVYAPVGLATYYHTLRVNPVWNRPLVITQVVGNHIFYRLPGKGGAPAAFFEDYAGREPFPGPLPRQTQGTPSMGSLISMTTPRTVPGLGLDLPVHEDARYVPGALPESGILPQYQQSGRWIAN